MFRERQFLSPALVGAVALVSGLSVGWLWRSLFVVTVGRQAGLGGAILGSVMLLIVIAAVVSIHMTTTVKTGVLSVALWPFARLSVALTEVDQAEPIRYSPMGDFGGWGLRPGLDGQMYSLRGTEAVRIGLTNGSVIYIGTAHPDALVKAIRQSAT